MNVVSLTEKRVVQVADVNEAAARDASSKFGIPKWTTDERKVIEDPTISAVVICSPTDKHAQQIILAAQNGKHIFCEKPIDLTLEVVDKAIKAVGTMRPSEQETHSRRG